MLFLNVSCGWIRTAAALSQKTAQKQPSGLFLAARLATSTRAHQDKTPRYVSLLALFFCGNPQSNPLFAGNYAKINKKKNRLPRITLAWQPFRYPPSPRYCKASPRTAPRWVRRSAGSQPIAERPRGSAPRPFLLHAGRRFEWQTTCSAAGLRWGYRSLFVHCPPVHRCAD